MNILPRIITLCLTALLLLACATDTIEDRRAGQTMVCHDGVKTLTLSNASALDHMQHGDAPGPCPKEG
jgi:hypothetical protein